MSTHYSRTFLPTFTTHCYNAARQIRDTFEHYGKGYPVLCYTGFSGIAAATMITAYLSDMGVRVEQVYVRKPGEKSHGGKIEFSNRNLGSHAVPVFVDDFVDSGKTHERVRQALMDFHNETEKHCPGYEPWNGFFFLSDLEPVEPWNDSLWKNQMMPYVLLGDMQGGLDDFDLRSELWENELTYLTEEAA